MSFPRKRAAIHKAYNEIDSLRQKLMLLEHHYSILKVIATTIAIRLEDEEAKARIEKAMDKMRKEVYGAPTIQEG